MAADLGAHFRSSKGGMMGGSSESESEDEAADFAASMGAMGGAGGWSSASEDGSDVSGRLDAETCAAGSIWDGSDELRLGFRCAEPEPLWVGSDDEAPAFDVEVAVKEEPVEESGPASSSSAGFAPPVADGFSSAPLRLMPKPKVALRRRGSDKAPPPAASAVVSVDDASGEERASSPARSRRRVLTAADVS
jgi:hypothetical protein